MDDLQEKLNGILGNPQMMQQLMAMAQAMGAPPSESSPPPQPTVDFAAIEKFTALAQESQIDKRERSLLQALDAYLSKERLGRLEKAMRAAKIAKLATAALSRGGF